MLEFKPSTVNNQQLILINIINVGKYYSIRNKINHLYT